MLFEREAKLLATIDYAHCAAVSGLDEHEGTFHIAIELVAGQTQGSTTQNDPKRNLHCPRRERSKEAAEAQRNFGYSIEVAAIRPPPRSCSV